jgi:hypothetical protein
MEVANSLAYYDTATITAVKNYNKVTWGQSYKFFYVHN